MQSLHAARLLAVTRSGLPLAEQAVEGADRTEVAAPAAAHHEEVEEKDRQHDNPRGAEPEDQSAVQHRYRIDQFPGDAAASAASSKVIARIQ
jgi:hypothetical protein